MSESKSESSSISFSHSEETKLVLDSLEQFIETEVSQVENNLGDIYANPRKRFHEDGSIVDEVLEAREEIRLSSAEAGFYAMNLPINAGGEGVSNITWYEAKKLVSSSEYRLASAALAGPGGPKPLLLQSEGMQVEKYLEPAIKGEKTTAFAQTEPAVGSDSPNMETTAQKDGDEWIINGQKQWITNAPYADFAQVFARTTPQEEAGRYGGITCFLVEADEYEVGNINNAVGQVGDQAELIFDNVRIPDTRVLGEPDNGFYEAMKFLSLGRLELGAEAVGHSQFLLEKGKQYASEREAFGQSIGNYQGVSHKLAKGQARCWVADNAGLRLAHEMDENNNVIEESSSFKWFATNVFWDLADDVVQVHGANGLAEENPFMNRLTYARLLRIVEGTDEIQLNTIAGQMGLQ